MKKKDEATEQEVTCPHCGHTWTGRWTKADKVRICLECERPFSDHPFEGRTVIEEE